MISEQRFLPDLNPILKNFVLLDSLFSQLSIDILFENFYQGLTP